MPRVTFDIHTILPPEQVLAMLTDFSARRSSGQCWPANCTRSMRSAQPALM
jgi:hypothetical protein